MKNDTKLKTLQMPRFLKGMLGFGEAGSKFARDLRQSMANACGVSAELLYPLNVEPEPIVPSSYEETKEWVKEVLDDTTSNPLERLIDGFVSERHRFVRTMLIRRAYGLKTDEERFARMDFYENLKIKILSNRESNYRAFIRTPAREMELSAMRFIFTDKLQGNTMSVLRTSYYYRKLYNHNASFYSFESNRRLILDLIEAVARSSRNNSFTFPITPSLLPEGYPRVTGREPAVMQNIHSRSSRFLPGPLFDRDMDMPLPPITDINYDYSYVPIRLSVPERQDAETTVQNIRDMYPSILYGPGEGPQMNGADFETEDVITGNYGRLLIPPLLHCDMEGDTVTRVNIEDLNDREIVRESINNALESFIGESSHPVEDLSSSENDVTGRDDTPIIIFDEDMSAEDYVNGYSYAPDNFVFHSTCIGNSNLYIGVELEIDCGGMYNLDALRRVHYLNHQAPKGFIHEHGKDIRHINTEDDELVYVVSDGSLNSGFEIVTHPCTLDYHKEIGYEDLFKYLQKADYKSHDTTTCGLHIHINRTYFGDTKAEQDLKICNLLYLIEKNWYECTKIARRGDNRYSVRLDCDHTDHPSPIDLYAQSIHEGKYACVNLLHPDSVEIRMFRGTLNYDTFISTLEFVKILATISKNTELFDINKIMWSDIEKGFSEQLSKYFISRKALHEKSIKPVAVSDYDTCRNNHTYDTGILQESFSRFLENVPSILPAFSIRDLPDIPRRHETNLLNMVRGRGLSSSLAYTFDSLESINLNAEPVRELTEEERINRDINDLRARSRRRGINYMEAQGINRKIAKLERELRAIRTSRNTPTFQYTPAQGFQYQPQEQESQTSELGSSILDNVTPGALARIPILSNDPSFDDTLLRHSNYDHQLRALYEDRENHNRMTRPAIAAFERWAYTEYAPVQDRIVIRNPSIRLGDPNPSGDQILNDTIIGDPTATNEPPNPICTSWWSDITSPPDLSTINSACSGADVGEVPLVAWHI